MMWVGLNQLKAFREKREGILPLDSNNWVSSLLTCPADFRLTSPHNHVSQFLKINQSLPLSPHTHTSYRFCFSGEPWLILNFQGLTEAESEISGGSGAPNPCHWLTV